MHLSTGQHPNIRVVFYHCGAHQHIVDLQTSPMDAVTSAIISLIGNGVDANELTEWTSHSSENTIQIIPIS